VRSGKAASVDQQGQLPEPVVFNMCHKMNEHLGTLSSLVKRGRAAMDQKQDLPDAFFQEVQQALSEFDQLWVFWKKEALRRGTDSSTLEETEEGLRQIRFWLAKMGFQRQHQPN
jgi:hypothetical protein